MPTSKPPFLAIALAFLSACSSNVQKQSNDSQEMATFLVEEVRATVEASNNNKLYQSISTEKLLNFTACVKDIAVREPIVGEAFEIKNEDSAIIRSQSTDSRGCLTWSEMIPYNALAPETYISMERSVRPLRAHRGLQKIAVAVNPWKESGEALVDLRYRGVPKLSDAKTAKMNSLLGSHLLIDEVASVLDITKASASSLEGVLRLTMFPKIKRMGILDGDTNILPLSKGKFRLRFQLVSKNNGQVQALTSVQSLDVNFENALLRAEQVLTIADRPSKEGILEMHLAVEPLEAPEGLRTVEGIISLGKFDRLSVATKGVFRDSKFEEISFDQGKELRPEMDYTIGEVAVEKVFAMEISKNTGRPAKLQIHYKTRLQNAISDQPLLSQEFIITEGEKERVVHTDAENGFLRWSEELRFNYFQAEHFIQREIRIRSRDGFYGDSEKTIRIAVNPWQYENPALFLVDESRTKAPTISAGTSEMILTSLPATFIGMDFEVDKHLNLSATRQYRVELRPTIRRMTAQGWVNESLGNGRYLLQAAIESANPGDPELIAYHRMQVEAKGDAIIAVLPFRFHDLRAIFARNNIVVQLTPLEKNSGLRPGAFMGAIEAIASGSFIRMEARTTPLKGMKQSSIKKLSGTAIFQKGFDLISISEKERAKKGISEENLEALLRNRLDSKHLAKLCTLFYRHSSVLRNCANKPQQYITGSISEHAESMRKKAVKLHSDSHTLSLNAALNVLEVNSKDLLKGDTLAGSVQVSGNLGPSSSFGNIGVGGSWGKTWFTTSYDYHSNSNIRAISMSTGRTLTADEREFDLYVNSVRCLNMRGKQNPVVKKTLQLCSKKVTPKVVREQYYFVYMNYSSSPLLDMASSITERPWTFVIRGKARFEQFSRHLQSSSAKLTMVGMSPIPASILKDSQNKFDGFFPGLLTIE